MVTEEISFGKNFAIFPTSFTDYKINKKDKKTEKVKKTKKKSIIIHESEKPSLCFEEISSGKMISNIVTSITNYKENTNEKKK